MTFHDLYNEIEKNQEDITSNNINFLPLYHVLPALRETLPGIIRSEQLLISANSGVGKTKFCHFLISTFLALKEKKSNLKINVIYNSLEESESKFKAIYIIAYLRQHGEFINYYKLMGYSETKMTARQMQLVKEAKEMLANTIDPYIDVVAMPSTVKFHKYCQDKILAKGRIDEHGDYVKNDPNEWFIIVSDHIGCYINEPGKDLQNTLRHFCITLSRVDLGLKYGAVNILIQQQVQSKEAMEVNVKAKSLIEKVKPSIDGLALYKNSANDATVIIGIFDPHKWKEHLPNSTYAKINLNELEQSGRRMRSLCFLKTREGVLEDRELPLIFDGSTNTFSEFPKN